MHDPTRIPRLTQALQRAWEGQPDLNFAQLIGVLQNRGLGWGTTDDETMELFAAMEREHPSLIDATAGPHTITTLNPPHLVTITGGYVVVRSGTDPERMPSVWRMGGMRKTGPGLPLVVSDEEGVEHRLGIVSLVERIAGKAEASISIAQSAVGSRRWLVQFSDGARAVVGQRIRLWRVDGRAVDTKRIAWSEILRCEPGAEMEIAPAGGGMPVSLGLVQLVLELER